MSLRTVAGRERGVVVDGESQTGERRQQGKGGRRKKWWTERAECEHREEFKKKNKKTGHIQRNLNNREGRVLQ